MRRSPTAEDVLTARSHLAHHTPLAEFGQEVCSSAAHRIVPPEWPCPQYQWARTVLDADARGEIDPGPSDEVGGHP
jgi:hypothetical protein